MFEGLNSTQYVKPDPASPRQPVKQEIECPSPSISRPRKKVRIATHCTRDEQEETKTKPAKVVSKNFIEHPGPANSGIPSTACADRNRDSKDKRDYAQVTIEHETETIMKKIKDANATMSALEDNANVARREVNELELRAERCRQELNAIEREAKVARVKVSSLEKDTQVVRNDILGLEEKLGIFILSLFQWRVMVSLKSVICH